MDGDVDFTIMELERFSYRYLQKLAKFFCLPSNVKKVHLIQLIYAKKYKTDGEVNNIVQRVKRERQLLAHSNRRKSRKKIGVQGREVSSTITSQSPPITMTPKRSGMIVYSPRSHPIAKKTLPTPHSSPKQGSDRVLRSFNLKTYKKPKFSILNNGIIGVIKAQKMEREDGTQISIIRQEYPINLSTKCLLKKHRMSIMSGNQLMPMPRDALSLPSFPVKHQRMLCHTNATQCPPKEETRSNFECMQSIGFRRTDGKISKINALVQKKSSNCENGNSNNVEVTIQDIINCNIDAQTFTNPNVSEYVLTSSNNYPNMSSLTDVMPTHTQDVPMPQPTSSSGDPFQDETFSVYYHKKIRAEQVKQRQQYVPRNMANEQRLPKINDVFSKFSNVSRDVMQPLYVQVSEEYERILNYPLYTRPVLETLYNFKQQYLGSPPLPLLQIAAPDTTTCVYSTPTCVSVVAQQSATELNDLCHASYERDNQSNYPATSDDVSRMYDFLRLAEQEMTLRNYHEVISTSNTSVESQEVTGAGAVPDMVEDALEIISQDGDYMERIGMDVRMQCILCSWGGPKFILDHHVNKEHSDQIQLQDKSEWNITYKLGTLVAQPLWLSQVTSHRSSLYVLSVKYEPDYICAALSTLKPHSEPRSGSITIYNKVTGQPYSWEGVIQHIPSNMPYDNDGTYLKLDVSELDLMPNSANLKLVHNQLVLQSPTNAVVGRVELDDIHIIVFVKIF